MGCYAVAAMLEEPPSVACRHHVESSAHRLYERLAGTRPGPPQERLELSKRFFYGVEIVCVKGSKQTRSWSRSAVRVRSSALSIRRRYAEYSERAKSLVIYRGFSASPVHHRS